MKKLRSRAAALRLVLAASLAVSLPSPSLAEDHAGYLYTYALNDARYDDTIVSLDAYKPLGMEKSRVRPYADFVFVKDSRTVGGSIPQIYSDNYALGSLGVQYTIPGSGMRAFAQGGISKQVGAVAAVPSGGDLRYGVQEYREWGGDAAKRPSYGNVYASGTYLSRYSDGVLYAQVETGRSAHRPWAPEPFARIVLTLDTRTFYYSNLAEMTVGVRFRPLGARGIAFSLEQVAGAYLRNARLPVGTGPTYHDFRPTIAYGMNL